MKKVITQILISVLLIFLAFFLLIFNIPLMGLLLTPAPEAPVIRKADINFRIKYMINGTVNEISDTLVCTYSGVEKSSSSGMKYRSYSTKLANEKDSCIILGYIDDNSYI